MEIRLPEDGVCKVLSKDVFTSEQIWNILSDVLREKDCVFAAFSTFPGMYAWTLPGMGWTPLSEADEATQMMVRDILAVKHRAVTRALTPWPTLKIEALFTVPSDEYVFFREGHDGQYQIMLAAWDYRFPDRLEGMEVKMPDDLSEKRQDVTLKFIEADRPVPGYGLLLKLSDGRFTDKITDEAGCFPMPGLEIGKRFTVLSSDRSRDFSFMVEEGRSEFVYDLTGDVSVEVRVTRDTVPAADVQVLVYVGGREYGGVSGADGIARMKVHYRRDAQVTAVAEGKEAATSISYPLTRIDLELVTEMATVIVEYFLGDDPVCDRRVLVRTKGMDDNILHTDSGGRASCRVPLWERSYVVAHSGRFVDKKVLQPETLFRFVEPVPAEPPKPKPEPKPTEVDEFGNPEGDDFDLEKDGAMKGHKVVILNLPKIDFAQPKMALERKGFSIVMFSLCSPTELESVERILEDEKTQLWVISDMCLKLDASWHELICRVFMLGHGLYVLSDNDPFYADSNIILSRLFRTRMRGDYRGDRVLSVQSAEGGPGIIKEHPVATGIRSLYEGITISHVRIVGGLKPLVYSSNRKVVTAYFENEGKRALVDGGFTRLEYKWDSAGTDRFVVNCACWLAGAK